MFWYDYILTPFGRRRTPTSELTPQTLWTLNNNQVIRTRRLDSWSQTCVRAFGSFLKPPTTCRLKWSHEHTRGRVRITNMHTEYCRSVRDAVSPETRGEADVM